MEQFGKRNRISYSASRLREMLFYFLCSKEGYFLLNCVLSDRVIMMKHILSRLISFVKTQVQSRLDSRSKVSLDLAVTCKGARVSSDFRRSVSGVFNGIDMTQ